MKPIIRKDGSKKPKRIGKTDLIFGRVILDLGHSMASLGQASDRWRRHKNWVSKAFLNDPEAYFARLNNIISRALEEGVEILLLPACVLVWEHPGHLQLFMKMVRKLQWVICGSLFVEKKHRVLQFSETAFVCHKGQEVTRFDNTKVKWLQASSTSIMVAISSTIKRICDEEIELVPYFKPLKETGIIACDIGHHSYSIRYRKTLKRVLSSLRSKNNDSIVILAFWKFRPTGFNEGWVISKHKRKLNFLRKVIPHGTNGGEDFLDILRLR